MDKIVIYGAGKNGRRIYDFFKDREMEDRIECFCDRNWREILCVEKVPVKSYSEIKNGSYVFIISINGSGGLEIEELLKKDKKNYYVSLLNWIKSSFKDPVERERNIIAFAHVDNPYFEEFDNETDLGIFWKEQSSFYRLFKQLDLSNVIELACGKGRHVPQYINYAGYITLVDILKSNLECCKTRFGENAKISYYCNSGTDLKDLRSNEYSALFTYDAMVHFEMLDIYSYLKETYRVLKKGGMALFHHSNLHNSYDISFDSNRHCRNFMSKKLFAHLAWKCGFEIVDQKVIPWGSHGNVDVENLDCISLVRK